MLVINNNPEIKKVIFNDVERNLYDDSYFKYVYLDLEDNSIKLHEYGATAYGGYIELKNSIELSNIESEEIKNKVRNLIDAVIEKQAIEKSLLIENIEISTVVNVSNKRARNFKNETFVVSEIYDKKFRGSYVGCFLVGHSEKYGRIESNINNCSIVSQPADIIEMLKSRVYYGH